MTTKGPSVSADGPWTRVQPPVQQKETRDHMTTTTQGLRGEADAIAARRTDTIRVLTVDQRAGFLRELAEHVDNEQHWALKPFTDAVAGIVPAVASAACPEPLAVFDRLVEALGEQRKFNQDPSSYANAHDWPGSSTGLDRLTDRLQSNVDAALQELLEDVR